MQEGERVDHLAVGDWPGGVSGRDRIAPQEVARATAGAGRVPGRQDDEPGVLVGHAGGAGKRRRHERPGRMAGTGQVGHERIPDLGGKDGFLHRARDRPGERHEGPV